MFSRRMLYAIVALVGTVVAAYALPWSEPWREIGPLALVLALASIGLLVEFSRLARTTGSNHAPGHSVDAQPADGTAGIVPMAGVRSEPNPNDTRFRRFVELNVLEQVGHVARTTIVQDAWARGQSLTLHGWVYGIADGLVKDLGIEADSPARLASDQVGALAAITHIER